MEITNVVFWVGLVVTVLVESVYVVPLIKNQDSIQPQWIPYVLAASLVTSVILSICVTNGIWFVVGGLIFPPFVYGFFLEAFLSASINAPVE